MSKFSLEGKTALVTGASRGIGLGIARGLAESGADVVLTSRSASDLVGAAERLKDTGRTIRFYEFDMGRVDEIPAMYSKIVQDTGGIDILVNNAGITRRGPAHEIKLEDWELVIKTNLTAVFAMCQAFARERIDSGKKGKIINIASLMSEGVRRDNSPYAASKGGIRQLTKALAVDWAPYGINVNAIGPGYIRTELTKALWDNPELDAWVTGRTPLGRWGTPEDMANSAVFLASDEASFITGQILYTDGGWLATF